MAEDLIHDYDAAKRREYYLKTRQLTGHEPGVHPLPSTKQKVATKPPVKTLAQRRAERKAHLESQVAALKGRLEKLKAILEQEVKVAQARSGVSPKKTPTQTSNQQSNSKIPKLTASQKTKKAEEDKKRRKMNPDQQLEAQVKSLIEKIKRIKERIDKMHKNGSIGARKP